MHINKESVPVKPYVSWTFVQDRPETLRFSGHTSMDAARRHSSKANRQLMLETIQNPETREGARMSWGYGVITPSDRECGIVL